MSVSNTTKVNLSDEQALAAAIQASLSESISSKKTEPATPKEKTTEKVNGKATAVVAKKKEESTDDAELLAALKASEVTHKAEKTGSLKLSTPGSSSTQASGKDEKPEDAELLAALKASEATHKAEQTAALKRSASGSSSAQASSKNAKTVKPLTPTKNEKWVNASLGLLVKPALDIYKHTSLKGVLEKEFQENGKTLTPETWERIKGIDVYKFKTVGDVEKQAITLINEMEDNPEKRAETHEDVKKYLKLYADKGMGILADIPRLIAEGKAKKAAAEKAKTAQA
jgi:hypothetical protein